jgi:hypothetical protein
MTIQVPTNPLHQQAAALAAKRTRTATKAIKLHHQQTATATA